MACTVETLLCRDVGVATCNATQRQRNRQSQTRPERARNRSHGDEFPCTTDTRCRDGSRLGTNASRRSRAASHLEWQGVRIATREDGSGARNAVRPYHNCEANGLTKERSPMRYCDKIIDCLPSRSTTVASRHPEPPARTTRSCSRLRVSWVPNNALS